MCRRKCPTIQQTNEWTQKWSYKKVVCVCVCVCVCLWHVSVRIFNLFIIPLKKMRLRAFVTDIINQLAWKCIKKTVIRSPGLTWLEGLLKIHFYVKLTGDQVRISLKRTFMYFPWFYILPPLLKSSQKFTLDGQIVILYYRKHPNASLHLFVIDFTILDRFRTFRNNFFEKMWLCYAFHFICFLSHFYSYLWNKTEILWKRDFFIVLPPLVFSIDLAKMLPFPTFTNSQFV